MDDLNDSRQSNAAKEAPLSLQHPSPSRNDKEFRSKKPKSDDTQLNVKQLTIIDTLANTTFDVILDCDYAFRMLLEAQAKFLIDPEGAHLYSYCVLEDGGTYTLGRLVTAGQEVLEQWSEKPDLAGHTKRNQSFDFDTLGQPRDYPAPYKLFKDPEFVAEFDWMQRVMVKVLEEAKYSDGCRRQRVSPMAVSGCSCSGKSRALQEMARYIKENTGYTPIYISFTDDTSIESDEQSDPIQALCRRIAFGVWFYSNNLTNKPLEFQKFLAKEYYFDPLKLRKWLEPDFATLLIDDLDNLTELTIDEPAKLNTSNPGGTRVARAFGDFLRGEFMAEMGRYLIFSSHALPSSFAIADILDRSRTSDRRVMLQTLPTVDDLEIARKRLNENLHGERDAVFYGLIPGIICTQFKDEPRYSIEMERAVVRFNAFDDATKMRSLRPLFASIFAGNVQSVPGPLQALLATRSDSGGDKKIIWTPYAHLYILKNFDLPDENYVALMRGMADLLMNFKTARDKSGDGWEALFCFQLIARRLARMYDDQFICGSWFGHEEVTVEFNNRGRLPKLLKNYTSPAELLSDFKPPSRPTISFFWPEYSPFHVVDIVGIYTEDGKPVSFTGYQLKEGHACPEVKEPVPTKIIQLVSPSLISVYWVWVRGEAPRSCQLDKYGWSVPSADAINSFFGMSGWYWTPEQWRKLAKTSHGTSAWKFTLITSRSFNLNERHK
ncbi:hypothetical protein MPSEU_000054100 [Mayamaea pseudoterrestris]|nr:hypothetical protein MPSEU_000054100 [Mayamaea pseudoterrestris]